jgi:antitoxin (DNA-binding transcriptional repressor) of toxin-antitoxin stability system
MRSMTDIEAANDFAAFLRVAEEGENVLITRDGRPVGTFIADNTPIGKRIQQVFRDHPADPEFADDLEAVMRETRAQPGRLAEWPTD